MGDESEGLRSRKKAQTKRALERAALELATERRFDDITIEAICDRAGVSRMTFFNYFPSKASAFTGQTGEIPCAEDLAEALAQRTEPSYLDAAIELCRELFLPPVDDEIAALRQRVLLASPEISFHERQREGDIKRTAWHAFRIFLDRHPERRLAPDRTVEDEASAAVHLTIALFKMAYSMLVRSSEMPSAVDVRRFAAACLSADAPGDAARSKEPCA